MPAMKEKTISLIINNFYRRGSEIAYVHRRGYRTLKWSYREIAEFANRLARELEERHIGPGDRVFLWGEDCAEWVVAFFGCVLRGVVVVPMDRIANVEFARRIYQQVEARLCFCSREQSRCDVSWPVLILENLPDVLARHSADPYSSVNSKSDDTIEIVFTSGTTAEPKGVVLSHKNILTNLDPLEVEIARYLKFERIVHPLRFLNLLPLSHVFGQFLGLFIPQMLSGTVIFHDTLNPSEIIRTIKRERVSVVVTVPRLMETLRDKIERDIEARGRMNSFQKQIQAAENEHFLKRWWRFRRIHNQFGWKFWAFISGGATLNASTEQFWRMLGFAVIQGYGLTETTSLISVNHPLKLGKGTIGKVLPGREIKLASDGEILVRSESIAKGYYQGRQMKPVLGNEGWFHTGDMGMLDSQGNLFFKGRRKSVIVSREGMNIYPEDLEEALRRQPEIRDCVVVGLERNGSAEPCAVLIMQDKNQSPESAVQRANKSLAGFQHMRLWYVWPEEDFPRTSTQKTRNRIIQEIVQAKLQGQTTEKTASGTLAELISRITGRKIEYLPQEFNLETDLNLSSIDRVELLSALEDRYQVDLNESHFTSATTVADLEKMMRQPATNRSDFKYPSWAQRWPVTVLRILVYYLLSWPATLLMAYPHIRNRENLRNLPRQVLFVANHITQVDVGFILIALPPRFRHHLAVAMLGEMLQEMRHPPANIGSVKRYLDKISYGLLVALFNVFPLPQRAGFRESFSFAGESADRGYSILVFPEGKRTRDGKMSPFRAGIGLLANNLNLPIVPIRIDGLFELKQKGKKFARPGTVTVTFGAAVQFKPDTDALEIAQELERRMVDLEKE